MKKKLIILASGGGSNAKAIIDYFLSIKSVSVDAIISNKSEAGVHDVAQVANIPSFTFNKEQRKVGLLIDKVEEIKPDLIILAGFLLKIAPELIKMYPNKIINIHPALLPKYGGKGMYGLNVHRAVVEAKEKESGISIHFVNENYDEGQIIKQVTCNIDNKDTAEDVQQKVLKLEHEYYPQVIEELLSL